MAEVKVLIEGYANEIENGWVASSTTTLIQTDGKNIIVDPGCNRGKLLEALAGENLQVENINFVVLTHSHLDHSLLAGIFPKAQVVSPEEIYNGDHQVENEGEIPGVGLSMIETPGHATEHCSLIIPTDQGTYVVAGDVFWWIDNEGQVIDVNKEDDAHPQEVDMKKLIEARKKILEIADYVIPGHGKMFKVNR